MRPNSQHEYLLSWFPCFYDDLLTHFPGDRIEILRDKKHALACLESRGDLSFFTKDLPKVHNGFLGALERGTAPPKCLHLGWLLRPVWDEPESRDAAFRLMCHRQIAHALYKMELPYEATVERETLDRFVNTEAELATIPELLESSFSRGILASARSHLGRICPPAVQNAGGPTPRLRDMAGLTPRHGPGAVATGEKCEEKWRFKRLYSSLHQRFPYYDWFMVRGTRCMLDQVTWYRQLERVPDPTAKVVLVPKDSRGPRIISEEPLELQYMQQAYFRYMCKWVNHPLTRGHVNFLDQCENRRLALESSRDRAYATLDLKDASDRVSVELVRSIFPDWVGSDLMALRSHRTVLPDGRVVSLRKFAPMGSSVCFPTLALVCWSVACAGLQYAQDLGEYDGDVYSDVFVFGDDLIVPSKAVTSVRLALRAVGLRVNGAKSFSDCLFRESCGVDAYNGVDITPTRIRHPLCRRTRKDLTYLSYLSYVNSLRKKGWEITSAALQKALVSAYGDVAFTWDPEAFPGILVDSDVPLNRRTRWSTARSSTMVLTEIPMTRYRRTRVEGWARALRNTVGAASDTPDREQMLDSVELVRRWVKAIR